MINRDTEWDWSVGELQGAMAPWQTADQTRLLARLLQLTLGSHKSIIMAPELIREFGSLPALLAGAEALSSFRGIGRATIKSLKLQLELAEKLARERVSCDMTQLHSWTALLDYLNVTMAQLPVEHFRILFLNKKNRLIADEVQNKGTVDHTPIYPREVIRRCLELAATAIIIVHNHPSGDPTPSPSDVRMTKTLANITSALGITLHDHVIVGKSGHASFRRLRYI